MLHEVIILAGIIILARITKTSIYYITNPLYTELNLPERRVRYIQWRLYNVDKISRKSLKHLKGNKYFPDWPFHIVVTGVHIVEKLIWL